MASKKIKARKVSDAAADVIRAAISPLSADNRLGMLLFITAETIRETTTTVSTKYSPFAPSTSCSGGSCLEETRYTSHSMRNDRTMSTASKNLLLPSVMPSKRLIEAWRSKAPYGNRLNRAQLIGAMRGTALHEAAHAVTHARFGDELRFATILPTKRTAGTVEYTFDHVEHPHHLARAALAGPITDLICGAASGLPTHELALHHADGDLARALHFTDYNGQDIVELFAETATFVSQPHVWGTMVIVADVLLERGKIVGRSLHRLIELARPRGARIVSPSQGRALSLARNRLLDERDRPYFNALLANAIDHILLAPASELAPVASSAA